MEPYVISPDEVTIYTGNANRNNSNVDVLLTNKALVLTRYEQIGGFFKRQNVPFNTVYSVEDIKTYQEAPQIKQKMSKVIIQTLQGDEELTFTNPLEANKFQRKALEWATGKKMGKRGADKVKGAISTVNDALGIDTVDTAKSILENGALGSVGGLILGGVKGKKGKILRGALDVMEEVGAQKKQASAPVEQIPAEITQTFDEQIEAVKKLKDLLDAGILSEEEFEKKKKEIMGL